MKKIGALCKDPLKVIGFLLGSVLLGTVITMIMLYYLSPFWTAFVEEPLCKIIPVLLTYSLFMQCKSYKKWWIAIGLIVGTCFSICEIITKLFESNFSLAMLTPVIFIHIPASVAYSSVFGYIYKSNNRIYWLLAVLVPIITILWHLIYNGYWGYI